MAKLSQSLPSVVSPAIENHPLAKPFARPKLGTLVGALVFVLALYWSYRGTNVDIPLLIDGLPFFWRFLSSMFPPNPGVLADLVTPVLQTIQMSILGTTAAVFLSLPFALLAAKNTAPNRFVYQGTRMFLNANRSIPDLIIALMFVAAVGLGPFPGMIALAVGSIGFMGKLFAESFEQINPRQVEAVRASGANRVQTFRYAIMPQALPLLASYSLLLWEINVRSATILGLVGAGGIGLELQTSMRLFLYQDLAMIILLIIVMVTVIDRISSFLRARITEKEEERFAMNRKFLSSLVPLLAMTIMLAVMAGCGEDSDAADSDEMPDVVRIGLIPSEDTEEVLSRYKPIKPWLEEKLGAEVEFFVGTDYSATYEALKSGRLDAAFINSFGYILSTDQNAVELLLVPVNPETGEYRHYHSGIITHVDSGIETLEDLRGKDFGFVDPASTSGHLVPEAGLISEGFDPWKDMTPVYAGGHDVVLLSVANQTLPAGANSLGQDATLENPFPGSRVERMDAAGQIDQEDIRAIWVSDPIPSGPVVVQPNASDILKERLKETLMAIDDDPDAFAVFENSYGEGSDELWDPLREAATLLGLDLEEVVNN